MAINQLVQSFNAGELSPYLDRRTTIEKYQSGCRTLENFLITPYGAVVRRPGTEYMGDAANFAKRCRLFSFNVSTEERFVIETGEGSLRIWDVSTGAASNIAAALAGSRVYEVGEIIIYLGDYYRCRVKHTTSPGDTTPGSAWENIGPALHDYLEGDLREIQIEQINNVAYFAHGNHWPMVLRRLGAGRWTWQPVQPRALAGETVAWPALMDQNVNTDVRITCARSDGSPQTQPAGTGIVLTATADVFVAGHVGSFWEIAHDRPDVSVSKSFAADGSSGSLRVFGEWSMTTYGTWSATLRIERSYDGGTTWDSLRVYAVDSDRNIATTGRELRPCLLRLTVQGRQVGTSTDRAFLEIVEVKQRGIVRITDVTSPTVAQGFVVEEVYAGLLGYVSRIVVTSPGNDYTSAPTVTVAAGSFSTATAVAVMSGYVDSITITDQGTDYPPSTSFPVTISGGGGSGAKATATTGAGGKVIKITIDEDGSGYTSAPKVTIRKSADGTDATATAAIKYRVKSITVTARGSGYTSVPSVSFSGGGGTGAAASAITVVNTNAGATPFWSEGAWSTKNGFPKAVAFHENRLWLAGTAAQPQVLWGSNIDDYENFRTGTLADAGLAFTLVGSQSNRIQWMESQSQLIVGTAGGEWALGSVSQSEAISPTNVRATAQSAYGSRAMRAISVADALLFVQRQGRKVRELVYDFQRDGWVAGDLTLLAEHVTQSELVELAYQQQPDSVLWAIRGDGQLIGMTYERDQQVVGWHRHTTQGEFESVAIVYGEAGDEIWLAVKRVVNGAPRRYIERFRPDAREVFDAEDRPSWWYLDCAKRQQVGSTIVPDLEHLEGLTVGVLLDGDATEARTVIDGQIVLPEAPDPEVEPETVTEILIESIERQDDDLMVMIDGVIVKNSRLNIARYNGETENVANPSWATTGFRKVRLTDPDAQVNSLVEVFTYDGWGTGYRLGRWTATVTFSSGRTQTINGGRLVAGNSEVATPSPIPSNYYTTGPHFDRYYPNGGFRIEADPGSGPKGIVLVGLPYESRVQPMKLAADLRSGTSVGMKARVYQLVVSLLRSVGGEYSTDGENWNAMLMRTEDQPMDAGPPPFTGDLPLVTDGVYRDHADVILRQRAPLPFAVRALAVEWSPTGK